MAYFTIKELCASDTAKRYKIDNTPDAESLEHLRELISVLDTLREQWGSSIRVNSGYRCPKLNRAVGGSVTSVHRLGYAADLWPTSGQWSAFVKCVRDWAESHKFDQILIETNARGGKWIHIGLYNNQGQQRRQIKIMNVQ